MGPHVPVRRCVGCGRVAPKPALVRLAAVARERGGAPRVAFDAAGALPGRGAYLCRDGAGNAPKRECLEAAVSRKAFPRAFRRAVDVPSELVESVGR